MEPAVLAVILAILAVVLWCVQVPICGVGPLWLKKVWTRIIRIAKRGDKRTWNWTEIEAHLYVGSLPRTVDNLRELQAAPHNLGAVVSLVEPWEMMVGGEDMRELDVQWLLLPTPDYTAPRICDIEDAVAFIDRQIARGRGVLVHCNAGRGRSVVVALAYLMMKHRAEGWNRYLALETVQKLRPTAELLACCELRPQWRVLRQFERRLATAQLPRHEYYGPPVPYAGTGPAVREQAALQLEAPWMEGCNDLERPCNPSSPAHQPLGDSNTLPGQASCLPDQDEEVTSGENGATDRAMSQERAAHSSPGDPLASQRSPNCSSGSISQRSPAESRRSISQLSCLPPVIEHASDLRGGGISIRRSVRRPSGLAGAGKGSASSHLSANLYCTPPPQISDYEPSLPSAPVPVFPATPALQEIVALPAAYDVVAGEEDEVVRASLSHIDLQSSGERPAQAYVEGGMLLPGTSDARD